MVHQKDTRNIGQINMNEILQNIQNLGWSMLGDVISGVILILFMSAINKPDDW